MHGFRTRDQKTARRAELDDDGWPLRSQSPCGVQRIVAATDQPCLLLVDEQVVEPRKQGHKAAVPRLVGIPVRIERDRSAPFAGGHQQRLQRTPQLAL